MPVNRSSKKRKRKGKRTSRRHRKPIFKFHFGHLITDKTVNELLREEEKNEDYEKLDRLMKERGIEAGDYKTVARELAINPKLGFKPTRLILAHGKYGAVIQKGSGGRPIGWTQEELDKLLNDVDNAKERYALTSDEDALRYIHFSKRHSATAKRLKNILSEQRRVRRLLIDWLENPKGKNPKN
jgi:hypothetical protein